MPTTLAFNRSPLFADLSADDLARLAALARTHRYGKGHLIFSEGEAGTALYLVARGRVKISQSSREGKERTLVWLGPGDVFGELALLDGGTRSADAVVAEDAELLVISRDAFLAFVTEHPRVAMSLLAVLSRRLRHTNVLVHDAAFFDVRGRLARVLLELAGGANEPGGPLTCPPLTQSDLAGMIGATRESVNKWLRYYERSGTVTRRKGRLVVLDPRRLAADVA